MSLGLFTGARDLPALKLGLVQVGKNGINPSNEPVIQFALVTKQENLTVPSSVEFILFLKYFRFPEIFPVS